MQELNKYFLNNNRRHFLKNLGFGIGGFGPREFNGPAGAKFLGESIPHFYRQAPCLYLILHPRPKGYLSFPKWWAFTA